MKRNRSLHLSVLAVVLLVVSAGLFVFAMAASSFSVLSILYGVLEITMVFAAFLYVLKGFTKQASVFYKLYFLASSAVYLAEFFFFSFRPVSVLSPVDVLVNLLCYSAYLVLAFGTDLGRKKSLFAVSVPLVLYAAMFVFYGVLSLMNPGDNERLTVFLSYLALVPSSLLEMTMVYGKYSDKTFRKGSDADR